MRYKFFGAYTLLSFLATPILAQPKAAQAAGCTQAANMQFGLSSLVPVTVIGVPITIKASQPKLVIKNVGGPKCEGARTIDQTGWIWRMDVPAGSQSKLTGTDTLQASFTPDRAGTYTVHLNGCGDNCKIVLVTDFVNGKPFKEEVEIGDPERQIVLNAARQAQVPPHIIPPPDSNPDGKQLTNPEHYDLARSFCGSPILIGLGKGAEWFTTTTWQTPAPQLELLEGRVYDSAMSRIDNPFVHNENDAEAGVDVDSWLRRLMVDEDPVDQGPALPGGGLRIEWEWPEWPEGFRPLTGDRISVLGYHVVDCGHEIHTEIHPPIAVATHRNLPVLLPASVPLEEGKPSAPVGSNVFVPGVITDIWVNLKGGVVLDCEGASLKQPKLVPVTKTINGKTVTVNISPCVPQTDQPGRRFEFHVFLPKNPQRLVSSITGGNPPQPALFAECVNHPETPAGSRTDLRCDIVEKKLEKDKPYITVSVDISQMRAGQSFAKRLRTAWVYPDITGRNYGLRAHRVRLNQLQVTKNGDRAGSASWRFWVGYSNAVRPWTRLIACDDCVDEKTYLPSASIFLPGALTPDGVFKGELLEFHDLSPSSTGRLRMTGYDKDTFGSDDTGEVNQFISGNLPLDFDSVCDDQTTGSGTLDPSNSGCAAYKGRVTVEPGQTPVAAVVSSQAKAFLNQLMVGEPLLPTVPPVLDTELFSGPVTARVAAVTSKRKVEAELWQDTFKSGAMAREIAASKDPDEYAKAIRKRLTNVLGARPTPQRRAQVKADLLLLKPSIPKALYQKHLCDLETGAACPAVP